MFIDSAKDIYNKYHKTDVPTAKNYWLKCLELRLASNIEREHATYYINKINAAKAVAIREARNHD